MRGALRENTCFLISRRRVSRAFFLRAFLESPVSTSPSTLRDASFRDADLRLYLLFLSSPLSIFPSLSLSLSPFSLTHTHTHTHTLPLFSSVNFFSCLSFSLFFFSQSLYFSASPLLRPYFSSFSRSSPRLRLLPVSVVAFFFSFLLSLSLFSSSSRDPTIS